MKRRLVVFLMLLMLLPSVSDAAVYEFDDILDAQIKEYGVFDGAEGLIYASMESFDGALSLFTAYFKGGELGFSVFDNTDGAEKTDELSFPVRTGGGYILSIGSAGQDTAVILTTNGVDEAFVIRNDSFTRSYRKPVKRTVIAEYKKEKLYIKTKTDVFTMLKSLKNKRIRESRFYNTVNNISKNTKNKIIALLSASADVMTFDRNLYDTDRLMKYVLNTHKNFTYLIDIPPVSGGGNGVSYVSADFIDYIMKNIFLVEPVKPEINELVTRGYCISGTSYYYREMFNVYFSTQILDIIAAYDLGGGVYYVVFSDIYYRGDAKIEEYSFAVIKSSDDKQYSVLRLGMGEPLLSDSEIAVYAPLSLSNNHIYTVLPTGKYKGINTSVRIIAAATAAAAAVFAAALVVIKKLR